VSNKYIPTAATIQQFVWRKTYFEFDQPNPVYSYMMIDHLYSDDESNTRAIRAFRGSSKSSNVCLTALHRCELPDAYFTMIVSATATLAEGLIADIKVYIEGSSLPYTVVRAVANELHLKYKGKNYYILGVGAGSALRGTKRGGKRADLIVTDDLMTMEIAMNKVRSSRLTRWYYSDLRPSLDPVTGQLWTIGTPMTKGDIFAILCDNNPVIDIPLTDTAWPDRFTPEWIAKTRQEYIDAGVLSEWKREMELVITDRENQVFETAKIKFIGVEDLPEDLVYFMTVDGAFSERETADVSAITVLGVDSFQNWYAIPYGLKAAPNKVGDKVLELAAQYNVDNVGIEKGSFKLAIGPHLEEMMPAYQVWFTIHDLNTAGSKLSRIKALSGVINTGRLTIVDVGDDSEELTDQIELTTHEGVMSTHDDFVDSLCQALQLDTTWYPQRKLSREDYRPRKNTKNSYN